MDQPTHLDWHQARLHGLWERLVHTLGVHTVNVLLDRAIWQVAQQYPALARIQWSDQGLSFTELAGRPLDSADEAFGALYDEMLMILARLLGREMAQRLVAELNTEPHEEPAAAEED